MIGKILSKVYAAVLVAGLVIVSTPAFAQGVLNVEIVNGYNLVVDSNVTAPSTYAPASAYIGARVCNTAAAGPGNTLDNVFVYTGNFAAPNNPGVFPSTTFVDAVRFPHLVGTGSYALKLESGSSTTAAEGQRYIGSLAPGQCRTEYWLISYPRCVNVGGNLKQPPCTTSIAGGVKPTDDPSLNYDVWATTSSPIAVPTVSRRRSFTMRNEISAAANKIWPNTTSKVPPQYLAALQSVVGWGTLGPDGQPLTGGNPIFPGQRVITTQGIWYDLGNVGQGFDNDGDLIPDQNAWLQPVGDPSQFDTGCFRMVNVYGVVIVKLKSGGEMLLPFQNELYFEHIPDNTGVVGLVYYQYIATKEGCNSSMTPYQEAASGFDNEKFAADYGLSLALQSGNYNGSLVFSKTDGQTAVPTGTSLTYTLTANNTTGVNLGAPDLATPFTIRDKIPTGTTYVAGSAPAGLPTLTGTGTYTQGYTDTSGNLDLCTINYNITSSSWTLLYSGNGGSTWSTTVPGTVTDIQWVLRTTIALDGRHNGTDCVAPTGSGYNDGTIITSLPAGRSVSVTFQAQVATTGGPVVCNTAIQSFGGASSGQSDTDCTLITGDNSIAGNVFRDNAPTGVGIYGNGVRDGAETGIGAGVIVTLYYDANGNGKYDTGDLQYATTTTNANGDFTFTGVPDGPFVVVVKKYDGATSDGFNNAATDAGFGTNGWGNTTFDPNLPLTTATGVLLLNEDLLTASLAVNVDLPKVAGAINLTGVNFGFAPPLRVTKTVTNNPDADSNGVADTTIDEGSTFSYTIALENRLPSVGVQGPTGCQYTVWATAGGTGSNPKDFSNPTSAFNATSPDGSVATASVTGGSLRWLYGTNYRLASQLGNITKVEGLFFGYFNTILTDDFLNLTAGLAGTTVGSNGLSGTLSSTTIPTSQIDSYVGSPPDLDPNRAISWDMTSQRPGGGAWGWADFPTTFLQVNPSKTANADAKVFSLDAVGLRVTTDKDCEAGPSTTLSPVPLQDTYDVTRFAFVSASPAPTSVNTGTGVIQWDDVGPILPGTTKTVIVTVRALNVSGTVNGSCPSTACNSVRTDYSGKNVKYADGRQANDGSSQIAVNLIGRGEVRGTVFKDLGAVGWPMEAAGTDPRLPNVVVSLYGCVLADGVTLETGSANKPCSTQTNGNTWKKLRTAVTDVNGAYEFIGLQLGHYIVEVGDNDNAPGTGSVSPFGGTQTAEANDTQNVTGLNANGHTCPTCDNNWGNPNANLNTMNQIVGEEIINGVDFGYNIPSAVIYGNVWHDIDGNAVRGGGEGGLSGFTVRLYQGATLVATTTSDVNGNFSFNGLAANTYTIDVTPASLPNKSWVETVETTVAGGTIGTLDNRIQVTVAAGALSGQHTFGYTQRSTSNIGDTVYLDFNGNGVQDPSEVGIPNITVWLYKDVDRDGVIDTGVDDLLATTSTDASGKYLFSNLAAGSYIVKVDTADTDFPTNVTQTGDPDLSTGRIGNTVYYDQNGNGTKDAGDDGIPGVKVNLYRDANGNGVLDVGEGIVESTTTNVNGNYLFTGLGAGRYFVDILETTLPSTALVITTADPFSSVITLASNSASYLLANAGYSPALTDYAIGNRVWHDVNNNGLQDGGEVGLPNVTITVTRTTAGPCFSPACTATTNAAGFWLLTGLTTGGTYTVNVTSGLPRDFILTTGVPQTNPRNVTISGADVMSADFGYRFNPALGSSPTASVTGRVFLDADADLAYDVGEERVGTTVNLINSAGYIIGSTTTDASGNYAFNGVAIGSYTVQSVDPLGTRYSAVFLSSAQAFTGLNVIYTSTIETVPDSLGSASIDGIYDNLQMDFGYQRFLGSIGDTVYHDVNENATQDLGEPGIPGVTVTLCTATWTDGNSNGFPEDNEPTNNEIACDGGFTRTTTTSADDPLTPADESGKYLFANLPTLPANRFYFVTVNTATFPVGTVNVLIADPDTDGVPCTILPSPDVSGDEYPPPGVCDSKQLVTAYKDGNNYLGADFGYRITGVNYATIGDRLWVDTNGNGVFDSGEAGVRYVTVWMDANGNGTLDWTDNNGNGVWDSGEGERWVETDANGFYVFTNVADGSYNIRVRTSDPDWPAGLPTTPTFEAGTAGSFDNFVVVTVSGGAVNNIGGNGCSSCNLNVDFGYRYAGTRTLSGTLCRESSTLDGFCGNTATTYNGVGTGETALAGIQIGAYLWNDAAPINNMAWNAGTGALDSPPDTYTLLGTATTNGFGDYSFSNLPDSVILVFSIPASQNLRMTTTQCPPAGPTTCTSIEGGVISRQLYEGTSTYNGNTVTVLGRQAISLSGNVLDADFAFDATLGGAIAYDFGDLPTVYSNTLLASGGAQQRVTPTSIHLGGSVAGKADGTESSNSTGDPNDDGVTNPPMTFAAGDTVTVDVNASANGWLIAWIDWNGDGDFLDSGEKFIDRAVSSGSQTISFPVPSDLKPRTAGSNNFFVRFRIYPSRPTLISSTGLALDSSFQGVTGEIEDYLWDVNVTPALVSWFGAREVGRSVALGWETVSEVGTVGFRLERWDDRDGWVDVSGEILPALITSPQGGAYQFIDRDAIPGMPLRYRLVEIESSGRENVFGPYVVNSAAAEPEDFDRPRLLPDRYVRGYSKLAHSAEDRDGGAPLDVNRFSMAKTTPAKVAPVGAKIAVSQTGIQFVPVTAIEAAGYPVDKTWLTSNKNLYAFTNRDELISFMAAPDASGVYFYGQAVDSIFAKDNVYWLGESKRNSPRMKVRKEGAVAPPRGDETFDRSVHYEKDVWPANTVFANPEKSFWVWDYLVAGQGAQSYTFRTDGLRQGVDDVFLNVRLVGGTDTAADPDHHAVLRLNGRKIADVKWDGTGMKDVSVQLAPSWFGDGENTLEIEGLRDTAAPYSIFYLDSIDVRYRSLYRARMNRLEFTADRNASMLVSGFTRPDIMVFDITDTKAPVFIEASAVSTGTSYGVLLSPSASQNKYIALTPDAVIPATRIKPDTPSDLRSSSNIGEHIIITTRDLMGEAQRLADHRVDLGSRVVDIEDVWDEFNYGVASPHALRDFLTYAAKTWVKPPKYVVLAGDGSWDHPDNLGLGGNLVPPMAVKTPFGLYPSDNWFANTDTSTTTPEISIGRLPAKTSAELGVMIDKIIARERKTGESWLGSALVVADNADIAGSFPADSDQIAAIFPTGTPLAKVYLSNMLPAAARAKVINDLNAGVGVMNYVGHGSLNTFASEGILRIDDLQNLTNAERPTIVTAATCLTGYFSYPGYDAIGERLLRGPAGGAAAIWSASGMSQNEHAVRLLSAFHSTAKANVNLRLGDVIREAMRKYEQENRPRYLIETYELLGDPAMKLK